MANHARPIETLALEFRAFVRDLETLCGSDNELDPQERDLILRARKKSDQLAHINAMSALITHLERLDVDDKVTPYSARLAERANLHIANLDDHRPQPDKIVPIFADRNTAG